jgi:hypothetical protein
MEHPRRSLVLSMIAVLAFSAHARAATIVINNIDGAGEGFNDPTPVAPVGGNPGTTLGQQRLNAFQYAADLAGLCLVSNVPIQVNAAMNPLTCTATSAVLGSAGAVAVVRDFAGAPLAATWYPIALANAITGIDNDPGNPDISAQFNSSINGSAGCLSGYSWYYGYDGILPPNTIDFVTVVMHEIVHGLGFQSFINVSTGAEFLGYDDDYEANSEHHGATPSALTVMSNAQRVTAVKSDPNLHWVGPNVTAAAGLLSGGVVSGHVQLYGPATVAPGSTFSHWNSTLTPNESMEPFYAGVNHNRGLATELLKDIGWTVQCPLAAAISSFSVRAVERGAELSASFESTFPNVLVRVYRGEGSGGLVDLTTQAMNGDATFRYVDDTVAPGKSYRYMIGVVDGDGEFVSPIESFTMPAAKTRLDQNSPNPFNPTTAIRFSLSERQNVTLVVYDVNGRRVRALVSGVRNAGSHTVTWDGRDNAGSTVSSGVYFYRLDAGKFSDTKKMVLLK